MAYIEDQFEKELLERLVSIFARRFSVAKIPQEELEALGKDGVEEAKRRYNPNCKFKFIPYAVWFIKQSINIGINKRSEVLQTE